MFALQQCRLWIYLKMWKVFDKRLCVQISLGRQISNVPCNYEYIMCILFSVHARFDADIIIIVLPRAS